MVVTGPVGWLEVSEAEKAVLGAALIRYSAYVEAALILRADDFEKPAHRNVFEAMGALVERGSPIDPITLEDELRSRGERLAMDGGPSYLVELAKACPVSENVRHYAEAVARDSSERRLKLVCSELVNVARTDPEDAQKLVLEAQRLVTELSRGRTRPGSDLADLAPEVLAEFQKREAANVEKTGRLSGLPTSIKELDYHTNGLRDGSLNIVAARTGQGKTALVGQMALFAAVDHRIPVIFFSLEMRPLELTERFFATLAPVENDRLQRGSELDKEAWKRIFAANAKMVAEKGLFTISPTRTLGGIVTEARAFRVRNRGRRALVVVDYIQLVTVGGRGRTREQEVAEVSSALKGLATELELPVVAPAQLSRRAESEPGEPKLTDLRESGAIENDADLVLFIERERGAQDGRIRVMKNRHGPVEIQGFEIVFHGPTYRIREA